MNQFYPTPSRLAYLARNKFKSKNIVRILEPSAGRANLLSPFLSGHMRPELIDCIEIDLNNQAILRAKGLNVIDGDFMQSDLAAMYSHIIMNPPFNHGADHVLKAFDLLINGELVAIVNAETVHMPNTAKRQHLVSLIQRYGEVEFHQEAFTDPDTLRKTNVEIALIWMQKTADIKHNFTETLEIDTTSGIENEVTQGLALRGNTIGNAVAVFNASVASLRSAELAQEEASYYKNLLGMPLNRLQSSDIPPEGLQTRFNKGYDDLKDRAWANILQTTEFSKYLSSKAYDRLTSDFVSVKKLNFTEVNIRGFLLGLVGSQADMNMQMLLDCFDEITKYIPENRAYYRGWKSNLKHKEQAYRVQMTRFIIPRVNSYYSGNIAFDTIKKLGDFDKTFAMLDGKAECAVSLAGLFSDSATVKQLEQGERLSSTYFDVRYYPGVGSIHFFPTNKPVIDRLNRLVGKERQWLPQDDKQASKGFWNQFNAAEKITRAMKMPVTRWGEIEDGKIAAAHLDACAKVGVDISDMLLQDIAA
jgi:hypothetical protein